MLEELDKLINFIQTEYVQLTTKWEKVIIILKLI